MQNNTVKSCHDASLIILKDILMNTNVSRFLRIFLLTHITKTNHHDATHNYDYYIFKNPSQHSWLSKDTLMRSVLFRPDCRNQRWQFGPACQVAVSCLPMWRSPMPQLSATLSHCTSNEQPLAKPSFTATYVLPDHPLITATSFLYLSLFGMYAWILSKN